jgi:hypothetical protein
VALCVTDVRDIVGCNELPTVSFISVPGLGNFTKCADPTGNITCGACMCSDVARVTLADERTDVPGKHNSYIIHCCSK